MPRTDTSAAASRGRNAGPSTRPEGRGRAREGQTSQDPTGGDDTSKNLLRFRGVVVDDPVLYENPGKTPLLVLRIQVVRKLPSGDEVKPIYSVNVWGDAALRFGAGADEIREHDVVEGCGHLTYEPHKQDKTIRWARISIDFSGDTTLALLVGEAAQQDDYLDLELEGVVADPIMENRYNSGMRKKAFVLRTSLAVEGRDRPVLQDHRIQVWGDAADLVWGSRIAVGTRIALTGTLRADRLDREGKRYDAVVAIDDPDRIRVV